MLYEVITIPVERIVYNGLFWKDSQGESAANVSADTSCPSSDRDVKSFSLRNSSTAAISSSVISYNFV